MPYSTCLRPKFGVGRLAEQVLHRLADGDSSQPSNEGRRPCAPSRSAADRQCASFFLRLRKNRKLRPPGSYESGRRASLVISYHGVLENTIGSPAQNRSFIVKVIPPKEFLECLNLVSKRIVYNITNGTP